MGAYKYRYDCIRLDQRVTYFVLSSRIPVFRRGSLVYKADRRFCCSNEPPSTIIA